MKDSASDSTSSKKIDIHATSSQRGGLLGLFESKFRRFKTFGFVLLLCPVAFLYVLCMGVALTPGISLMSFTWEQTESYPFLIRNLILGLSLSASYLIYGFVLIFVVPLVNKILPLQLRPLKSSWYSLNVIPWYYHNALTYLVRYTFLDFITPTPLNKLFYQMMGMKIGKGSIINTSNISDPCLIEIGDYVTIGGSASLVAHYGQKGILIIEKLIIKNKATIGLKASLFGDVVIGEEAFIKPHEVVLPKSRIPDRLKKTQDVA